MKNKQIILALVLLLFSGGLFAQDEDGCGTQISVENIEICLDGTQGNSLELVALVNAADGELEFDWGPTTGSYTVSNSSNGYNGIIDPSDLDPNSIYLYSISVQCKENQDEKVIAYMTVTTVSPPDPTYNVYSSGNTNIASSPPAPGSVIEIEACQGITIVADDLPSNLEQGEWTVDPSDFDTEAYSYDQLDDYSMKIDIREITDIELCNGISLRYFYKTSAGCTGYQDFHVTITHPQQPIINTIRESYCLTDPLCVNNLIFPHMGCGNNFSEVPLTPFPGLDIVNWGVTRVNDDSNHDTKDHPAGSEITVSLNTPSQASSFCLEGYETGTYEFRFHQFGDAPSVCPIPDWTYFITIDENDFDTYKIGAGATPESLINFCDGNFVGKNFSVNPSVGSIWTIEWSSGNDCIELPPSGILPDPNDPDHPTPLTPGRTSGAILFSDCAPFTSPFLITATITTEGGCEQNYTWKILVPPTNEPITEDISCTSDQDDYKLFVDYLKATYYSETLGEPLCGAEVKISGIPGSPLPYDNIRWDGMSYNLTDNMGFFAPVAGTYTFLVSTTFSSNGADGCDATQEITFNVGIPDIDLNNEITDISTCLSSADLVTFPQNYLSYNISWVQISGPAGTFIDQMCNIDGPLRPCVTGLIPGNTYEFEVTVADPNDSDCAESKVITVSTLDCPEGCDGQFTWALQHRECDDPGPIATRNQRLCDGKEAYLCILETNTFCQVSSANDGCEIDEWLSPQEFAGYDGQCLFPITAAHHIGTPDNPVEFSVRLTCEDGHPCIYNFNIPPCDDMKEGKLVINESFSTLSQSMVFFPAEGIVRFAEEVRSDVHLTNATGQVIKSATTTVDLSVRDLNLTTGIYFLSINSEKGAETLKIFIP